MGIVLGIGLIVGTLATRNGSLWWAIPLILSLVVLIAILPATTRLYLFIAIAGFTIAALVGALRPGPDAIRPGNIEETRLQAIVQSDPKVRGEGVTAYLQWGFLDDPTATTSFAFLPSVPQIGRHDQLMVSGRYDQSGILFVSSMRVEEPAGRLELLRRDIRDRISSTVHISVPGSPGTLALGLLIGDDSGLTESELAAIRRSGLSHITAVSGWNVTLVIVTVGAFFAALRLRSWKLLLIQLTAISVYVWIVGIDPPVLRAALMGFAALIAIQLGRPVHLLNLLVLAAAAMIVVTPDILSSLSFQLSFLSLLGLIGALTISLRYQRPYSLVLAPAVATIAAATATAPLLAMRFGTMSLGTLPANLLVTPLVPLATYSTAFVALTGPVQAVSQVIGMLVWILCWFILRIAELVASVPGSYWEFEPAGSTATTVLYVAMAAAVFPLFPEGRYLLRSVADWANMFPAQACTAGLSTVVVLIVVLFTI